MQAPNEHNPEYEMYRQVLMRERRNERLQGWIFTILGAALTLLTSGFLIWSFQRILTYGLFSMITVFICALGFLTFSLGLSSLRRASKLPTVNEIAHTRRFNRFLVLYALGVVPYERCRLPIESAELLAKSLVAGEVTEGVPLEQEER